MDPNPKPVDTDVPRHTRNVPDFAAVIVVFMSSVSFQSLTHLQQPIERSMLTTGQPIAQNEYPCQNQQPRFGPSFPTPPGKTPAILFICGRRSWARSALAQTPWLNHGWHVTLYVTARGLTTSLIPHGARSFEMLFDFNTRQLVIDVTDGGHREIALKQRTVADFYGATLQALRELRVPVEINERPCEIAGAIRFSEDQLHQRIRC